MLRFKVSGVQFMSLLTLISLHCIKPNLCLKTIYKFKKIFSDYDKPFKKHYYCSECFAKQDSSDEDECINCLKKTKINYYLEIPIIDQLEKLYKRSKFVNSLNHVFTRQKLNTDNFEDIYDGQIYKELIEKGLLMTGNSISFMWYTDGVPIFKSSKFSMWPFFLVINELPYQERFKRENMIMAGLWFGPKKPSANLFMETFRGDLEKLSRGVFFETAGNDEPISVRGFVICGTCDLAAKAQFMNMKQYNGYYGYQNCKQKGEQKNRIHVYLYSKSLEMRTTTESIEFARMAIVQGGDVYGVKGPTVLSNIVYKYIESTAIDLMHCGFVNLAKKIAWLLFDSDNHDKSFSLRKFVSIINKRMLEISPPNFVPRLPRSIDDIAYWKASELKLFLLVYSLPILVDMMEPVYFKHHRDLVYGIYLLNQVSVSAEMINQASELLNKYVSEFGKLYGEVNMTCNLHLLLHLPEVVRRLGPLWVTSCFPLENMNGVLKSFIHGTKYVDIQVCSSVSWFFNYSVLKERYLTRESEAYEFCKRLETKSRLKTQLIGENVSIVGGCEKLQYIQPWIMYCLRNMDVNERKIHIFYRLLKKDLLVDSNHYTRERKTKSCTIEYSLNGVHYIGTVELYVKICNCECEKECYNCDENHCKSYAIVTQYHLKELHDCSLIDFPSFIYQFNVDPDRKEAIPVRNIEKVLFEIIVGKNKYVIMPVNTIENE